MEYLNINYPSQDQQKKFSDYIKQRNNMDRGKYKAIADNLNLSQIIDFIVNDSIYTQDQLELIFEFWTLNNSANLNFEKKIEIIHLMLKNSERIDANIIWDFINYSLNDWNNSHNFIANLELIKKSYFEEKGNLDKIFVLVFILQRLKFEEHGVSHYGSKNLSLKILKQLLKQEDNYFIKMKLKSIIDRIGIVDMQQRGMKTLKRNDPAEFEYQEMWQLLSRYQNKKIKAQCIQDIENYNLRL